MSKILSAVIAVGNYENHLDKIKEMLLYSEIFQLIFVCDTTQNEGSDKFLELLQKFPSGDIVFIEGAYGSPGKVRNIGKQMANLTWLTFWDCDDLPNFPNLLKLMNTLSNDYSDCELVVSQFDVYDEDTSQYLSRGSNDHFIFQLPLNPGLWRILIKNETQINLKFEEISMGEDQIYIVDLFSTPRKVCFSGLVTYGYRKHSYGQLTKSLLVRPQLVRCVSFTWKRLLRAPHSRKPLILLFLMKQVISLIKSFFT